MRTVQINLVSQRSFPVRAYLLSIERFQDNLPDSGHRRAPLMHINQYVVTWYLFCIIEKRYDKKIQTKYCHEKNNADWTFNDRAQAD